MTRLSFSAGCAALVAFATAQAAELPESIKQAGTLRLTVKAIVDGRVLIDGGRYAHGDEIAIASAGTAAIGKIWDLPEAQAAFNG